MIIEGSSDCKTSKSSGVPGVTVPHVAGSMSTSRRCTSIGRRTKTASTARGSPEIGSPTAARRWRTIRREQMKEFEQKVLVRPLQTETMERTCGGTWLAALLVLPPHETLSAVQSFLRATGERYNDGTGGEEVLGRTRAVMAAPSLLVGSIGAIRAFLLSRHPPLSLKGLLPTLSANDLFQLQGRFARLLALDRTAGVSLVPGKL
ncbi:hypothetical protein K435DRAFT_853209 [Dendrothele bispora CBS 962.96]|uniref:Uncharacterized protein n=1 Tax=Dendrothele bispora (strain CBS 962.96) TaxID=1314807 RepID=A0A4S8MHL5_DENBC|nr:hypothetical protein K435DRAFT_853209 [Dendrothele bispora CBS 962.96]